MTLTAATEALLQNDLDAYWMPFTATRAFKQSPRLLAYAKDMHYFSPEGRAIIDGCAGLWCVNAGHCRALIVEAIRAQAGELDFAPPFQFGHPKAFALASRIAALAPGNLDHVFFTNSGSEAVDTALKIALAYHNLRGEGARQRLVGRERGHHGSGFGGMAAGGAARTANSSVLFSPASITFLRPIIAPSRHLRRASRSGARILPTNLKESPTCTMPRRLPRLSSSPWPARPAFCRPPTAIWNG
jgi:adenosylmethionine-8-amino-7-oxononanoate aminotransferase